MTKVTIIIDEKAARALMDLVQNGIEFDSESYDIDLDDLVKNIRGHLEPESVIEPPKSPVEMKLHDQIEADGNEQTLSTLTQFVDWLQDTHSVTPKFEPLDPLHTQTEFAKLAFEFLAYDYDAWMAEKDELVKHLNDIYRAKNNAKS